MAEAKLVTSFSIRVSRPFHFGLTLRKPAGWSWSTPFEEYEGEKVWTALRSHSGTLFGLKLRPSRTGLKVELYTQTAAEPSVISELRERIALGVGADDDLRAFYRLGSRDRLVRLVSHDLRGMHVGFPTGVFERAVLAVCLQMAPLKRSNDMMTSLITKYGDEIKFDGHHVQHWPSPDRIARSSDRELMSKCNLGYRAARSDESQKRSFTGSPICWN